MFLGKIAGVQRQQTVSVWHPLSSEFVSTSQNIYEISLNRISEMWKAHLEYFTSIWMTRFEQNWNRLKVLVDYIYEGRLERWLNSHFPSAHSVGIKSFLSITFLGRFWMSTSHAVMEWSLLFSTLHKKGWI